MWAPTTVRYCGASSHAGRGALTATIFAAQGETQFARRESIPLEPSQRHSRSIFAVYRRGSEKVPHCREGHCARKILPKVGTTNASDWAQCRVACCCSALALMDASGDVAAAISSLQEDDLHHAADMVLGATLLSGSLSAASVSTIAPSLWYHIADARDKTNVDWSSSRMVSLCTKLDVPSTAHLTTTPSEHGALPHSNGCVAVARLLLTSEESESVWYFSILLQDEEMHSHRAIAKLKEIDSLKVLMTVCAVRHHAAQPPDHLGAHNHHHQSHTPESQQLSTPPSEVYKAVLTAVTKRKCVSGRVESGGGSSSASGVPPTPKLTCVDLAIAYTMRTASPSACLQFLCAALASANARKMPGWFLAPELIIALARDQLSQLQAKPAAAMVSPAVCVEWIVAVGAVLSSGHATETAAFQRLALTLMRDFLGNMLQAVGNLRSDATVRTAAAGPAVGDHLVGVDAKEAIGFVPLVQQIVTWQAAPPHWMTQELSGSLSVTMQAIVQWVARGNDGAAIQLLRRARLMDPLEMRQFVNVTVPLIASLGNEDTMTEVLGAVVTDSASMYTGGYHSDDHVLPVFSRAVAMKRAAVAATAVEGPTGSTTVTDSQVIDAILTDFALLGSLILRKPINASGSAIATDAHLGAPTQSIDPHAALLGGPVQFFRYLVKSTQDVWSDTHRLLTASEGPYPVQKPHKATYPFQNLDDDDSVGQSSEVGIVMPIAVQRSFTNLLERVVRAAMHTNQIELPLRNAELARIIEQAIRLPNLHDEYRQKLFLMVNVASLHDCGASPPTHGTDSAAGVVSPALQKLTGALPLQFLPWASIQIAKDVLASSSGRSPQFLHLLQTTVDLQLPPSTARSRVAGVLEVYKLIRSQRDKLSTDEYTRLLWRCFVSLPLSYFLSSWTFFTWWTFVGTMVLLHVTGWSWEAVYVVDARRRAFAQDLGIDRDGTVAIPASVANNEAEQHRPTIGALTQLINDPKRHYHPVGKCLVIATLPDSHGDAVAMQLCQALDMDKASPFVLRCGSSGGVVVVDDIVRDAAHRIRKESNMTRNPLKRLLFNLFPLFRRDAELALIDLTARQASSKKVPFTFFLVLAPGTHLSASAYQSLVHIFARRYVSSLVIVVPGPQTLHITKFLAPIPPLYVADEQGERWVGICGNEEDDDDDVSAVNPSGLLFPFAPSHAVRIVDASVADRGNGLACATSSIGWQSLPLFDGRHVVVSPRLVEDVDTAAAWRIGTLVVTSYIPDPSAIRQMLARAVNYLVVQTQFGQQQQQGCGLSWLHRIRATEHSVVCAVMSTVRRWGAAVAARRDALKNSVLTKLSGVAK